MGKEGGMGREGVKAQAVASLVHHIRKGRGMEGERREVAGVLVMMEMSRSMWSLGCALD